MLLYSLEYFKILTYRQQGYRHSAKKIWRFVTILVKHSDLQNVMDVFDWAGGKTDKKWMQCSKKKGQLKLHV